MTAYDAVSASTDAEKYLAECLHGVFAAYFSGNPEDYLTGPYEGVGIRTKKLAEDTAGCLIEIMHARSVIAEDANGSIVEGFVIGACDA